MQRYLVLAAIAASVVSLTTESAHAQGRGRGGMRMGNVPAVQLLLVDEVQAELKLTDEQKKSAATLHEEYMTGRRQVMADVDKASGERGPKIKELREKSAEAIAELLDDAQEKRLVEIVIQVNGAAELEDEKIAAALKITPEQEKQLSAVRKANAKARREALKVLEEGGQGTRSEILAKLQAEGDEKLVAVLTEEQRTQFEAMKGEKLELHLFGA